MLLGQDGLQTDGAHGQVADPDGDLALRRGGVLDDGELDLVVELDLALGRHDLAEVEEHARLALHAPDEAEAVLQAAHQAL